MENITGQDAWDVVVGDNKKTITIILSQTKKELSDITAEIEKLDLIKKKRELESKISQITSDLKTAYIEELGDKTKWKAEPYETKYNTVVVSSVITNRFNTKEFKKDYPELHKKYMKASGSIRISIKEKK